MEIYKNRNIKDLEGEIFRDIEGYNGDYQVSNFGRIKSFKRYKNGKILKQAKDENDRLYINLYKNRKGKSKRIHRLEFKTFKNCKLKKGECIHHIDENSSNNILDNFKLMTNFEHGKLHMSGEKHPNYGKKFPEISKRMSGENHPRAVLTEQKVIKIRELINEGNLTLTEIAKMFGVYRTTISDIKHGRTWKHI